jgi:hypothetical protein
LPTGFPRSPQDSWTAPRIPAPSKISVTKAEALYFVMCLLFVYILENPRLSHLKRKGLKLRHFVSSWFLETSLGKPSALVFSLEEFILWDVML